MSAFGNFDSGGGGAEGPFIQWSARGTQDGAIPAKTFYLRETDGKSPLPSFSTGVVMDIANMKTGWQRSDGVIGVAPEWKWNATVGRFEPQPGDDWKKGLSIRCAISKTQAATWEQAGAGAWNAFTALVPALQKGPEGKLPVVRMIGAKLEQYKRGSTVIPTLEVLKWVDRPDCLKEGMAAGFDAGISTPVPTPVAQPSPQAAPVAAMVDDEF